MMSTISAFFGRRSPEAHRAESARELLNVAGAYAASHPAYAAELRAAAQRQDGVATARVPGRTGLDAGYRVD